MMRLIFVLPVFILSFATLSGQALEGRVVDKTGVPIPDAYITKHSSASHTHTNALGFFRLSGVQAGDTVDISFIGFETRRLILEEASLEEPATVYLEETPVRLEQVVVSKKLSTVNQISAIDLEVNPVNSAQEVLRKVPGLFIAQHAGGGKAEQIFLRGFDIDHGTDIGITVDGMPVNMVSHAHGQGYADLHFLIPETIEAIDFGKGPYYAGHGNFTTAGYVDFQTKEKLNGSQLSLEYGQFNTLRTVGLFDLLSGDTGQDAYLAAEYMLTDGPFESSQNFNRVNVLAKYTAKLANNDKLSVLASHFSSKWDASGQIPQRAVDAGLISRFGAIDDTEGGSTGRTNVALHHTKVLSDNAFVKSRAYFSQYDFELFSNFTFFLNSPENGDQIRQRENRNIFGLESVLYRQYHLDGATFSLRGGAGLRYDQVDGNELSRTLNRKTTLEPIALGDINESNIYGFVDAELDFGKVVANPGLRFDYFKFDHVDKLAPQYSTQSQDKGFVSPKLNVIYNPGRNWQFFLRSGVGFHSNDTRVVVAQQGRDILPAAFGLDLGTVWKPLPGLWLNTALWYLFLEQEFVYVGDEGIVEPSGRTRRYGLEFGMRYQLADGLFFDSDINYTIARAIDEPEGADYIPLAPDLTAAGGLVFESPSGFSGGVRYRYIKDRPANEDGSITAEGYLVADANLNYVLKNITFSIIGENLLDAEWNEAQFATESRLRGEEESVEELHFTPGTPFFLRGKVAYRF